MSMMSVMVMSRALAIFRMAAMVRFCFPCSTRLMYVRSRSEASASCCWVSLRWLRAMRMFCPMAASCWSRDGLVSMRPTSWRAI